MKANLTELTIKIRTDLVTPKSPAYRPPSWPPPRDWPVVIDKNSAIVSRWEDSIWDFTPWTGKRVFLNFRDGKADQRVGRRAFSIDTENADLLRMLATWFIWGPRACYELRGE